MPHRPLLSLFALTASLASAALPPGTLDLLVFGDASSEQAHRFSGPDTRPLTAALGEPARVSLPKAPVDYYGGDLSFELAIDPVQQNYLTVKFWGGDVNGGQKALLYIDGEQLGYRHLGDYEALNHGATSPSLANRFFYYTALIPLSVTRDRTTLRLTLRTIGPISGYQIGGGYDGYQKKMEQPSRGYYRAYSHTTPALAGLDDETQGTLPPPPVRPAPPAPAPASGDYAQRQLDRFNQRLAAPVPLDPNALADFARLATAVAKQLAPATRDRAIKQLVAHIDAQSANAYNASFFAKGIYQGDWGGSFAPVADAIVELDKLLAPGRRAALLDETITVNQERQTRRAAWTRMIKGNFDYARTHIARITNQAMFCLHGAYRSNRALLLINPAVAEPEASAKRFIFEAAGITPYLGNDILDPDGRLIGREEPFGKNYYQITDKGLTREYTYVAIYGEVANEVAEYWERYGYDELLKKALLTNHARSWMKYSDLDEDGYRGMRMEGVIESRGPAYPDDVGYGQRKRGFSQVRLARHLAEHPEKYSGPDWAEARRHAREILGFAQQLLADHQKPDLGQDPESLADYAFVKNSPPTGILLPHTRLSWYSPAELAALRRAGLDENTFLHRAWADEDDGVVSLRDGDRSLFFGLVMKAHWGVNGLARVHAIAPRYDLLSTVAPDVLYDWTGQWSVRPDWTNVQFMNANNPPEGPLQVLAGEILPYAGRPGAIVAPAVLKQENPFVGYANFYSLRYLGYLIGMNTTRVSYGNARGYTLTLPANHTAPTVFDFISQKEIPVVNGTVEVPPQSTVVLRLALDAAPPALPQAPRLAAAFHDASSSVTVRWTHASGATGYLVRAAPSPAGPWTELARVGDANTLTTTSPATYFNVSGLNAAGPGPESPVTGIIPQDPALLAWFDRKPAAPDAAPEAPRDLCGENIQRSVQLSWKVARRGETYDVLRAPSADGPWTPLAQNLTTITYTDDHLAYGKTYAYTIVAANRDGLRGPATAPLVFTPVDAPLPSGWTATDIGDVGRSGVSGYLDGVFSLRGAGRELWGNSDGFHFVHRTLVGDGTLVARVTAQRNTHLWARSGLMLRETLAPDSPYVALLTTPGWGLVTQHRAELGQSTAQAKPPVEGVLPVWLKLARTGNTITTFTSADGTTWTQLHRVTQSFPRTLYLGLAVCSQTRGIYNLTTFDGVRVR